jgi:hypothetical protein
LNLYKHIRFAIAFVLIASFLGACKARKKDCRGKRKTTKTQMGGWM